MNFPVFRRLATLGVAASAAGLAACGSDTSPTASESPTRPAFAVDQVVTDTLPEFGKIKLCKTESNVSGTFAVSRVAVAGGNGTVSPTPTIANDVCVIVAEDFSAADVGSNVTISETSAGFVSLRAWRVDDNGSNQQQIIYSSQPFTNGGTLFLNNFHGYTIKYVNYVAPPPPPPPPPPPSLGCSPGYWKNHNFPSGYTKTTLFNTNGFANAFPGKNFQQVLELKGGGLNSLGRHTVSAYFNAVTLGSGYPLTSAAVVSMFNTAYASGDYTPTSDLFESYEDGVDNGITCPNPTGR